MVNDQQQINPASNAGDFQPTTQNPQSTGSNVQSPTSNLQPVQPGSTSAEQLYQQAERQPNLTVQVDSYSGDSIVSVAPNQAHSNAGLYTVTGALCIILVIMVIAQRFWRRIPAVDTDIAPAETVSKSEIANEVVESDAQPTAIAAGTSKKASSKKKSSNSKKKKKSSKKKR